MTVSPNIDWINHPTARTDEAARLQAEKRQAMLTKPQGALGQLEAIATQMAALQGKDRPTLDRVHIVVFAADHGVTDEGISAFPQSVTVEMLRNFAHGGAAINVLANELNAVLEVINLGTVVDTGSLKGVINRSLAAGTANFTQQAAMTEYQFNSAMSIGRQCVQRAVIQGAHLFIGGEMGIGNTTAATALVCALTDIPVELLAGPGTGLDPAGVSRKIEIIKKALALHKNYTDSPINALRYLGGFEIAALTGAYITCAQEGLPAVVDGFIASTAALVASRHNPGAKDWLTYSHVSAEPGHKHILEVLNAQPLINLGMRLGEGSGAAVAVPLLRMACRLHCDMATFSEAKVSGKK